jgi:hypothetical protein
MADTSPLRFAGDSTPSGYTSHALVCRDSEDLFICASRARDEDLAWVVRAYHVQGPGVRFRLSTRRQAEIAAILVEQFDDGEALTVDDEYMQVTPIQDGVPTCLALDGPESVVAWRYVLGDDPATIAATTDIAIATVEDMLDTVCDRPVLGFPDPETAPAVGEHVPTVPDAFAPPIPRAGEYSLTEFADTPTPGGQP